MIDLAHLTEYHENNRLEAKKATGGLPESLWETYSAFANTEGGVILLGVEELKDRSLRPVDLPDPYALLEDFWIIINDSQQISENILTEKDVRIATVDGKHIIVIEVPRADYRPIFLGKDPFQGSYRRSGDGDIKCTHDEVQSMLDGK